MRILSWSFEYEVDNLHINEVLDYTPCVFTSRDGEVIKRCVPVKSSPLKLRVPNLPFFL